jgi:hypothetical protein
VFKRVEQGQEEVLSSEQVKKELGLEHWVFAYGAQAIEQTGPKLPVS